jgi:cobalt-zinc-cadmium efflux system outer membrane protein
VASYSGIETDIARAERVAAEAEIVRERSLRVPDPTVSAGVRRFEESNDNAFVVGVSIPLPIRNRNQGNILAAQARARAAGAREAVALADYRQAVAEARAAYLSAEVKASTLASGSLPQADEALRLAQIGYRNGKFPLLEVLAAADARDAIRRSLIDAREAQGSAAARLIRLAAQ